VPDCKRYPEARVIVEGTDSLESTIMDRRGRLLYAGTGRLMRLDSPDAEPRVLAEGIEAPGGMAFGLDGFLYLGYGDSIANGAQGDTNPQAGILRVDPETGATSPFVEDLSMANGVVRGPAGELYASNDIVGGIERISADGTTVERRWANVNSANGLVIDRAQHYLYAAQTFQPAAIARVDLADPASVETFFAAGPADVAAGLDGMVRDRKDRLYVAANGAGEVWRVNRNAQACSLASMPAFPDGPSALTFGRGKRGFDRRNLYVVAFNGQVTELVGVRGPRRRPPPRSG
jgi:sugar lactone lactonase YvrE